MLCDVSVIVLCIGICVGVSIREEVGDAMTNIGEHLVEFLLGIEPVVLAESGPVVAHVLEDLLVEASPHRWDHVDSGCHSCDDQGNSGHCC